MKYKILLFDLDDTLLDFKANEMTSLKILFEHYGYIFSNEIFEIYNSINQRLWREYEDGKVEMAEVLNSRFSKTMLALGKVVDGKEWESKYRELLGEGSQLIDGALELCGELSQRHRMFIVTNGVTVTQIKRLKQSGLYNYFEKVFTSQSIGYQKPSEEFFNYVKNNISGFDIRETLIIGDSLSTDIKGGTNAGIDTCWININMQETKAVNSTYIINKLSELKSKLAFD